MGCLFGFIDLLFEWLVESWFALMRWIIPERFLGRKFRFALKLLVGIFSCLLYMMMFIGLFALISRDESTRQIGRYMVLIPLSISAIQIGLGVLIRVFSRGNR